MERWSGCTLGEPYSYFGFPRMTTYIGAGRKPIRFTESLGIHPETNRISSASTIEFKPGHTC